MVIKASAAPEIRALINALTASAEPDDPHREAAVARLAVIGGRAVERLIDAYARTTDPLAQVAILRTLESIGDRRSGTLARKAIASGGDVGVAAAGVLRSLLTSAHEPTAASALDSLIEVALDTNHDHRLRLAALEALQDASGDVQSRVTEAIRGSRDAGVHEIARSVDGEVARADAIWKDAVEGRLPDDPRALRDALGTRSATAPLNTLLKMIGAVREKEEVGDAGWLGIRGALHQTLALRGSCLALYDLRESLEKRSEPLPVSFLAALHVLGNASCLEPIASAWSRARPADERWRQQLVAAFRAIVQRERITVRHAVMKRIAMRSPDAMALWPRSGSGRSRGG